MNNRHVLNYYFHPSTRRISRISMVQLNFKKASRDNEVRHKWIKTFHQAQTPAPVVTAALMKFWYWQFYCRYLRWIDISVVFLCGKYVSKWNAFILSLDLLKRIRLRTVASFYPFSKNGPIKNGFCVALCKLCQGLSTSRYYV